jgi:hypothetical protein
MIYPFLQILSTPEKRQSFASNIHRFAGFRIPASVGIVVLDKKRAQPPNLNSVTLCKGIRYLSEKQIDSSRGCIFRSSTFLRQFLTEFLFVHATFAGQ